MSLDHKVIVVEGCFRSCPLKGNPHIICRDGKQVIAVNCESGSTKLPKNVNEIDITYDDPIPKWCPLSNLSDYGWKMIEGE